MVRGDTGHVVEASLGLLLIPLATVVAGVLVFGERLLQAQWWAVALYVGTAYVPCKRA